MAKRAEPNRRPQRQGMLGFTAEAEMCAAIDRKKRIWRKKRTSRVRKSYLILKFVADESVHTSRAQADASAVKFANFWIVALSNCICEHCVTDCRTLLPLQPKYLRACNWQLLGLGLAWSRKTTNWSWKKTPKKDTEV